jgi:hypothetical protein
VWRKTLFNRLSRGMAEDRGGVGRVRVGCTGVFKRLLTGCNSHFDVSIHNVSTMSR